MAHDKDAIRQARDRDMFDDGFDPLALGLGDDEKRRMARDLEGARADLEAGNPPPDGDADAAPAPRRASAPRPVRQPGLLDRFLRWLVLLFTGMKPDEYELKQRMKEVRRELARIKPRVYDFKSLCLAPALAEQAHGLASVLSPYSRTFMEIFSSERASSQLDFQLFFLRIVSKNQELDRLDEFTETHVRELAAAEGEGAVRRKLEEAIQTFLAAFEEEERREIDRVFAEMMNFRDLMEFNWLAFLRRFAANFAWDDPRPLFKDARPEGISRVLKDLEAILLLVNPKFLPQVLDTALVYFRNEIMSGLDPDESHAVVAHMEKMQREGYRPVAGGIARLLQDRKIGLLVRWLDRDPEYETHIYPRRTNFFGEFSRNLVATTEARIGAAFKAKTRQELQSKIAELFGNGEIPAPYVYNEESNGLLEHFELPQFLYAAAFNLVLHFFKEKYFAHHKRTINRLLVDGSFRNSLRRRMLSDEFYHMDEIYEELAQFSLTVNEKTEKGGMLAGSIRNFKGDLPSKKALSARINTINLAIYPILKTVRSTVVNLDEVLKQIVADLGTDNPETIDNLKKIAGSNNSRFLVDLKACRKEIELYNGIFARVFKETG